MGLISRKGYEKLKREYKQIEVEILKTTKEIKDSAFRNPDEEENLELRELKVKAFETLPARRNEIYHILHNSKIIEDLKEYDISNKKVSVGKTVKLSFNGDEETFTILGEHEGDITKNIVSCNAPLIKLIIGKQVGDTVEFNGIKVKILEISKYEN